MRKPPSAFHATIYIIAGFFFFIAIGGVVFFAFFYENFLNSYAIPKLEEAVRTATHGVYNLKLDRITYRHFKVYCIGFDLQRVRYKKNAQGTAVKQVIIDTVEFTGVNIWKILWHNSLSMTSIQMDSPKIYMTDLSKEEATLPDPAADSLLLLPSTIKIPTISFDSIALRDIRLFLPDRSGIKDIPSFRGIFLRLNDFYYNSETKEGNPVLFSKRADIAIPDILYPVGDGTYSLEFKNLRGNSEDSIITVEKFALKPNYSERDFADKYLHPMERLDFRCADIRLDGVNFVSFFSNANIVFRKFIANSWSIDSYEDRTKPEDPHPEVSPMPNDLFNLLPIKIDVDSIVFRNGEIKVRERKGGAIGYLEFTHTFVGFSPISKDTLTAHFEKPTEITFSTYFLGDALLNGTATYWLYKKKFDMNLHATIGSFAISKLNTYLIPLERLKITGGEERKAEINMVIRSGIAKTSIIPVYSGFRVNMLPKNPNIKSGITDKVKTFIAKSFILDEENPDEGKLIVGVTTHPRDSHDAFMQFIWESLRKSLGKVVGGFK